MVTKTLPIYPTERVPAIETQDVNGAHDGVPLRWLEPMIASILRAIPDEAERNTVRLFGVEHLRAEYDHTLTPLELAQDRAVSAEQLLQEIRRAMPRPGTPIGPEAQQRLSDLLGL